MSLQADQDEKIERVLERDPNVTIFLKPIAAPAALGLAGFAGSTWITAAYVASGGVMNNRQQSFFPLSPSGVASASSLQVSLAMQQETLWSRWSMSCGEAFG